MGPHGEKPEMGCRVLKSQKGILRVIFRVRAKPKEIWDFVVGAVTYNPTIVGRRVRDGGKWTPVGGDQKSQ